MLKRDLSFFVHLVYDLFFSVLESRVLAHLFNALPDHTANYVTLASHCQTWGSDLFEPLIRHVQKSTDFGKFESFHLHIIHLLCEVKIPLHLLLLLVNEAAVLAPFTCNQVNGTKVLLAMVVNFFAASVVK